MILRPVAAGVNEAENRKSKIHSVGDGHFFTEGERFDYRALMNEKLPPQCQIS
ncbi:hypothetical protein [Uruburuella suis]|uniref:hypothetical protein n=1 Tax=Uruburuella suis TaxID=252130 RepID=UPI003F4ACF29